MFVKGNATVNFQKVLITEDAHLIISNDSDIYDLYYSYDGSKIEGILYGKETIELRDLNKNEIYIKSDVANVPYRIYSFGNRDIIYKIDKPNIDVPEIKNYFEKKELF